MAVDIAALIADLQAETDDLESLIGDLPADRWATMTLAEPWTVLDQVGHLAYFDETATLAATDPERFETEAQALMARGDDFPDQLVADYHGTSPHDMLTWLRTARTRLLDVFTEIDPTRKLPWYGPGMAPASSLTARLMETWAHGQDIADSLGMTRAPTGRLRHIAHLGVRTRTFSYVLRGLEPPTEEVYVDLEAPDGTSWTWGPPDAVASVTGPALDFCLLVTQRRHVDDTSLRVTGETAKRWSTIAQAFAGAPGPGRPATGADA